MERRSLIDANMEPADEHEDVFDDEYEVEDYDGVADGFRPSDHDREARETGVEGEVGSEVAEEEEEEEPVRTVSAYMVSSTALPLASGRPSRSSTRKGGTATDNPFTSPDDGDEPMPTLAFEPDFTGHRSTSSASSHQFARTGSMRFGDGPSHPYGMYPQATMPRSPSITTQSTVRVGHRQSNSLRRNGPQHPYALYPQGVSEDVDDDGDGMAPDNPVPVGFPGLGQSYERRLGPDGEEQDMIGMYGHTEQLPPYSRYPEDGPEKVPLLTPEAPSALHSRAPVAGSNPTMDLMHTHIQPQPTPRPQSMMDASNLREGRPHSMASMERMHSTSPDDSLLTNKTWKEKSWKERHKTKFCGVPFWLILLAAFVLGFVAAVIGGVLGGFFSRLKHHTR